MVCDRILFRARYPPLPRGPASSPPKPTSCALLQVALGDHCRTLQIHWPVPEPQKPGEEIDPPLADTWAAMEKLVDEVGHSSPTAAMSSPSMFFAMGGSSQNGIHDCPVQGMSFVGS